MTYRTGRFCLRGFRGPVRAGATLCVALLPITTLPKFNDAGLALNVPSVAVVVKAKLQKLAPPVVSQMMLANPRLVSVCCVERKG